MSGILEEKHLGLSISNKGTFYNAVLNEELARIELKQDKKYASTVYEKEGHWISDVIDLGDKFESFGRLFTESANNDNSTYSILTRTSDNKITWSDWAAVAMDGGILSKKARYVQVKIALFAGIEEFALKLTDDYLEENQYVLYEKDKHELKLKRDYEFDTTLDTTWVDEGSLHRKKITRDEWLRIDRLNVISGT